jgi:bacterioferritin
MASLDVLVADEHVDPLRSIIVCLLHETRLAHAGCDVYGFSSASSFTPIFLNYGFLVVRIYCRDYLAGEKGDNMTVSLEPMVKASDKLKEMLNKAIAREIQVSVQYMWQHVEVIGVKGIAVQDKFKEVAIVEMKHAEKIAERLWYLGGTPTTKPAPIEVGKSLKEFLELDTKAEVEAIEMYREIVEIALKEGDITTAHIFRDILEEEEEHHDLFTTMLEEV